MNSDFPSNQVNKQNLKFNVNKCKTIKAEFENNKHEHFINRFLPEQQSCPYPSQIKQKNSGHSFKYIKAR